MIEGRTPGEKAAYAQGHRAGWEGTLRLLGRHKTPDEVRRLCETMQRLTEDTASARAQEPSPSPEQ